MKKIIRLCSVLLIINTACAYADSNIKKSISKDTAFRTVTNEKEIKSIKDSFQSSLPLIGSDAKITKCDNVVRFFGRSKYGSRNPSFGAHCEATSRGKKIVLFMCDDEMIGKFTVQRGGVLTEDWVKNLIEKNCSPGG